jgi:hypothetical protein
MTEYGKKYASWKQDKGDSSASVTDSCEHCNEHLCSIKGEEYLE